jgi:Holliday junction DNA helicase RuvA
MFYYLRGRAQVIDLSSVVVDCGGVGYLVYTTSSTIGKVSAAGGGEILIYTYVSVREDAFEIYGFGDKMELTAFKLLIGVSGIGPKAGISILSTLSPGRLAAAVMSGDAKAISSAPGVGAKTAARVILELKDKIGKQIDTEGQTPEVTVVVSDESKEKQRDVSDTLLTLGYTRSEISKIIPKLDMSKSLEDIIKEALRFLMR